MARVAGAFTALLDGLGYPRFAVHGGDWGSPIGTEIARTVPSRLLGLHLTMLVTSGLRPEDGEPTEEEKALTASQDVYNATEQGYLYLQSTKPQTLAYGLNDSPAGLAAWIVEKLRTWTDCDGDVESVLSRDEILAWITTFWVTGTAGSSARLYFETAHAGQMSPPAERPEVPVGIAVFPKELYRTTRRVAEHHYDVQRWTELPRGGHFPAAEQPGLLVDELRQFFRGREG
jgi:microsomal epoxide hydrolase